jgi:hypothetical protein
MATKKKTSGKVIKISKEVFSFIKEGRESLSADAALRKLLGIAPRKGEFSPPLEYWLIRKPLSIFKTRKAARGAAIVQSVRVTAEVERPRKIREII